MTPSPIDILRAQPPETIAAWCASLRANAPLRITGTLFSPYVKIDGRACMCAAGAMMLAMPDVTVDSAVHAIHTLGSVEAFTRTVLPGAPYGFYEFIYGMNDGHRGATFNEIAEILEIVTARPHVTIPIPIEYNSAGACTFGVLLVGAYRAGRLT